MMSSMLPKNTFVWGDVTFEEKTSYNFQFKLRRVLIFPKIWKHFHYVLDPRVYLDRKDTLKINYQCCTVPSLVEHRSVMTSQNDLYAHLLLLMHRMCLKLVWDNFIFSNIRLMAINAYALTRSKGIGLQAKWKGKFANPSSYLYTLKTFTQNSSLKSYMYYTKRPHEETPYAYRIQ